MKSTFLKAIALVSCITAAVRAGETVTVQPRDTGAALVNPGMGWVMYFYSNVPANYGSHLSPVDTVDDFPGLSTVFLRTLALSENIWTPFFVSLKNPIL